MAKLTGDNLQKDIVDTPKVHKPAEMNYAVFDKNGETHFQLNNLGKSGSGPKQILQFSREDAIKLAQVMIHELSISKSELEDQ